MSSFPLIRRSHLSLFFALLLGLTSCQHRDFCYDHPLHAPVAVTIVKADYFRAWELPHTVPYMLWRENWPEDLPYQYDDLRPDCPEALRINVYPIADERYSVNLPPSGGEVYFEAEGPHSLLFYNDDTEYIILDGMDSYVSSKASTRTRTRSTYLGNSYYTREGERTVNPPDALYTQYIEQFVSRRTAPGEHEVLETTLESRVFTYVIQYNFDYGFMYVKQARGALSGMADGVWLSSGQTTEERATLLYDASVRTHDVLAEVHSFGVPAYKEGSYNPSRPDYHYALNLELCLINGKVVSYDFDVTDQVKAQPRGGVISVGGIIVKDEDGCDHGGGFSVDVTEWGPDEPLPLAQNTL